MKIVARDGALTAKQGIAGDIIRVLVAAGLILLVPLVAMQFTGEVVWTLFDFAVAGTLLVGTGLVYVVTTRKTQQVRRKFLVGLGLTAALLLVWIELAVGIFGTPFAGQ